MFLRTLCEYHETKSNREVREEKLIRYRAMAEQSRVIYHLYVIYHLLN